MILLLWLSIRFCLGLWSCIHDIYHNHYKGKVKNRDYNAEHMVWSYHLSQISSSIILHLCQKFLLGNCLDYKKITEISPNSPTIAKLCTKAVITGGPQIRGNINKIILKSDLSWLHYDSYVLLCWILNWICARFSQLCSILSAGLLIELETLLYLLCMCFKLFPM